MQTALGTIADRYLWADACLRNPDLYCPETPRPSWVPPVIPDYPGRFYKRYPQGRIQPYEINEPGLWVPLSCAIAFVVSGHDGGGSFSGSVTVDATGANLVWVYVTTNNAAGGACVVTDDEGNGPGGEYVFIREQEGGFTGKGAMYYAENITPSASLTISAAGSGVDSGTNLFVLAFSGVATSGALADDAGASNRTGDPDTCGPLSTPDELSVFVSGCGPFFNSGEPRSLDTPPAWVTELSNGGFAGNWGGAVGYYLDLFGVIGTAPFWSGGGTVAISGAVFRPAGGGGGGNPWQHYRQLAQA